MGKRMELSEAEVAVIERLRAENSIYNEALCDVLKNYPNSSDAAQNWQTCWTEFRNYIKGLMR